VPATLLGGVLVLGRRRSPTAASRLRELLYVVLAYNVVVHGILFPEPRYMLPLRPVLFVLAMATVADVRDLVAARVATGRPAASRPPAVARPAEQGRAARRQRDRESG